MASTSENLIDLSGETLGFARARLVTDHDTDLPDGVEIVYLKKTEMVVQKGQVIKSIRNRYITECKELVRALPPCTKMRGDVVDVQVVAEKANKYRLLNRHKVKWLKTIKEAMKFLKEEREMYERMLEEMQGKRRVAACTSFEESFVEPSREREEAGNKAGGFLVKLMGDLKDHISEA